MINERFNIRVEKKSTVKTGNRDYDYEAIVVGLGPAGSNAAYHLARAGIRALAIEEKKMPRRKLCAGGISAKVINLLDFDYSEAIEQEIRSAAIHYRHKIVEMSGGEKVGYVVHRPVFDQLLALRAAKAGAEIHEEESVLSISEIDGFIEVKTNLHVYRCRALIGADGVNGVTAGLWGYKIRPADIGVEIHVNREQAIVRQHRDQLSFYFGNFSNGYAWIFPRKEGASVGLGVPWKRARHARPLLANFLESIGLPRSMSEKAKGHGIPLYSPLRRKPFCRRNILLAGDAASLVDPITAEGIYYALKSGEEAASAIIQALSTGSEAAAIYSDALKRSLLAELKAAWKLALPFYAFQLATFNAIMTNARIRDMQFDVIVGRRSYQEIVAQFPNMFLLLKKILFARFDARKIRS